MKFRLLNFFALFRNSRRITFHFMQEWKRTVLLDHRFVLLCFVVCRHTLLECCAVRTFSARRSYTGPESLWRYFQLGKKSAFALTLKLRFKNSRDVDECNTTGFISIFSLPWSRARAFVLWLRGQVATASSREGRTCIPAARAKQKYRNEWHYFPCPSCWGQSWSVN